MKADYKINMGTPSEKQRLFLSATERFVAYGGARGGGKSWAVRTKAKIAGFCYPGIRMLIVRRSYPELIENHIRILKNELAGISRYNDQQKVLVMQNGSLIKFTYCDGDKDLDRLQGQEYDMIFIDEASQLSEYQIRVISATCRGVNAFPKRIYLTCNPGGQGHAFIKRLFVDRDFREDEAPSDYTFIQALVSDNPALMESNPEYVNFLKALPPKLRAAWLDGRWDIFEGQFFEEWVNDPSHYQDRVYTHVIAPFVPPSHWKIYRSFDWGYAKPFSVGWWAVTEDGMLYRITELYGCRETPNEGLHWPKNQVFAEIARIEREHPWLKGKHIIGVADPAIWQEDGGESIAETAEKMGIYFDKGDHARIPGWMQVHYRLAFDKNGKPGLQIFSNCKQTIRTMPALQYAKHIPEDCDTEGEDHIPDEVRYMCMSRPIHAEKIRKISKYKETSLYYALGIPEEDLEEAPEE